MKNLTLGFLVFITTFLNAQSVDPETFPTVTSGIGIKYLYTNTGGEGKILIDSIKEYLHKETQNGLTYINGNTELGGNLLHPTIVDINTNPFLIDCGGFFNYLNSGFTGQGAGIFNLPNLSSLSAGITGHGVTHLSKVISATEIQSENTYNNQFQTNRYNGFIINYNPIGNDKSFWTYNDEPNNLSLGITLNSDGFILKPNQNAGATNWTAPNLFKIESLTGDLVTYKTNGLINELLPPYADDADAGANGLVAGDRYQTSGAGSAPLNVQGIVMIKQ